MKKIVLLVSLVVIAGLIFILNKPKVSQKRELITELTPLKCDLNQTSCKVEYKGKFIEFELTPRPLKILKETKIIIKNLDDIKDLNARLYGLNMYMGDIVNEFSKVNNEYVGEIVFSSCIEATMRYRLELFSNDKSLGLYIDFDVKR